MKIERNFSSHLGRETQVQAVRDMIKEFCLNSTIHGIRYLSERKHWCDRIWWIFAITLSISFCTLSIRSMWLKWDESPIVLGLTETGKSIAEIPFPTVTICPETKAVIEKIDVISAYHALKENATLTETERSRMEALLHICEFFDTTLSQFGNKFTNTSIYNIIQDIAPNDTTWRCSWQYTAYKNAFELFSLILTKEGLCFTFNALNSRDIFTDQMAPEMMIVKNNPPSNWDIDSGYDTMADPANDYPLRSFNTKNQAALIVYLQLLEKDLDLEHLCRRFGQGFRVLLSTPGDAIQFNMNTIRVPLLKQVTVLIKPTLTYSSSSLSKYTPSQRKCFFTAERQLRFFKRYSQAKCYEECLANFIQIECGCVKFSMPRDKETKICGAGKFDCYQKANYKLYGEDITNRLKDNNARSFRKNCNCLPACTTIVYDAVVDKEEYDMMGKFKSYKNNRTERRPGLQMSKLIVRFKDYKVETLKRSERYTFIHFISICGGLLGLFLGVSVLSIVEFIYYATIRLYWSLRRCTAQNNVTPINSNITNSVSIDLNQY